MGISESRDARNSSRIFAARSCRGFSHEVTDAGCPIEVAASILRDPHARVSPNDQGKATHPIKDPSNNSLHKLFCFLSAFTFIERRGGQFVHRVPKLFVLGGFEKVLRGVFCRSTKNRFGSLF